MININATAKITIATKKITLNLILMIKLHDHTANKHQRCPDSDTKNHLICVLDISDIGGPTGYRPAVLYLSILENENVCTFS